MPQHNVLTREEVDRYEDQGFLKGYQIFNEAEVAKFHSEFERNVRQLDPNLTAFTTI